MFRASEDPRALNLADWNSTALWRYAYGGLVDGYLFFAEDVFGQQVAIRDERIHFVDTETGDGEAFADDLEGWAAKLLANYPVHTGHTTAHEWKERHGPLAPGRRLAPKTPFVCGGNYELTNLYSADSVELMRFRGDFARQIKDLPDGTKIRFEIID